ATHDFVTRLHNRNALEAHVSELLAHVQVQDINASFLLIDIDRFRLINESCGCIAGDELLRQFSDSIAGLLTRDDFFARLGGDRFAVVTYCDESNKGLALAQNILKHLEQFNFQWEDRQFKLAASIATVPLNRTMVSYDQVMLAADEVIFVAKRESRGGIFSYDDAAKRSNLHKDNINWASRLVDAVHSQLFRAYFQMIEYLPAANSSEAPKYRLEVLLRLWDPQHERMISPGEFIGPAERLHLIPELDKWIVAYTLNLFAQHPQLLDQLDLVSINLSAISIREAQFAQFIINNFTHLNLPANKFCFEITETQAIVNVESARQFMQTLRELGCHFALDDFGSGFASYAYLHQLAFDKIKIDGIFVRDMDTDPAHYAMVKSIAEMATSLDKEVIAEFVETAEVAKQLHDLGVSWGQGYYHHRPEELNYQALEKRLS
ncbi:MAG: bifunctional diguanylate cyclase/phosphodiesterase, partial [Cellvibrio sp.]|uniref:EAL domain-containing protein n=1 Tax=Cellvibrio sp. TaxID=1965322 RepID=UPI0031A74F10